MAVKGVAEFYEGSGKKHMITTQTEYLSRTGVGGTEGICKELL